MTAEPVSARRRVGIGVGVAVATALLTSACAAGQQAQTANELPTLDGVNASVGAMDLRGLAIESPSGASYAPGSDPAITVVLVNSGRDADSLTSISSASATGWGASASIGGTPATSPVTVDAGDRVSYGVPESNASLVLRGLKAQLWPGNSITLTFTFAKAGSVSVVVPVQLSANGGGSPSYVPAPSGAASDS